MYSFETLAIRLASNPAFRAQFAMDPRAYNQGVSDEEQRTIERLGLLLTRSTNDLVASLLGQADGVDGLPWEWGSPPTVGASVR